MTWKNLGMSRNELGRRILHGDGPPCPTCQQRPDWCDGVEYYERWAHRTPQGEPCEGASEQAVAAMHRKADFDARASAELGVLAERFLSDVHRVSNGRVRVVVEMAGCWPFGAEAYSRTVLGKGKATFARGIRDDKRG